ncbi:hypothetical protein GCM10009665_16130 [Kitasatospora nipponensis]|uniref:Enamine deaminase RidA (YjgF/YER057c/UK114 family) n=1 Tax=Kitasatospora nipponensis TaxID=258049 RepID=A0ABN1VYE9_9ACTN
MTTPLLPPDFGAPIGRYTPGLLSTGPCGDWVFVSGQVATDAQGRTVGAQDIRTQTRQVFANLAAVLAEGGAALSDLLSVTVHLTSRADFAGFTEERNRVFAHRTPPTSTVVIVRGLVVPEHLVEVSGIARRGTAGR